MDAARNANELTKSVWLGGRESQAIGTSTIVDASGVDDSVVREYIKKPQVSTVRSSDQADSQILDALRAMSVSGCVIGSNPNWRYSS